MKLTAIVATTTALALALPSVARAGNTRVVVAGPENDAVASRLQKELTALGFEAVRVDDAASCAPGAIAGWIDEMHASGATCSNGTSVTVFVSGPSGVRVADVVHPRTGDEAAPDVVAMRAAEVARASIELPATEPDTAPPAPLPPSRPPPAWSANEGGVSPQVDAGLRDGRKHTAAPPYTPSFTGSLGMSAVMGADVTSPALDMEMELRVYRRLAIAMRGAVPVSTTQISTANSAVSVSPGIFGVGPVLPLASSDSLFVPRVGGGVGVAWLNAQTVFTNAQPINGFASRSNAPTHDNIVSPAAYLSAAISMRVVGPLRLVVDGLLGTTAHRMVVRADGEHIAYWGQPFGSIAMRGEIMFR